MSRIRGWLIALLGLLALILIGVNLADHQQQPVTKVSHEQPVYQSQQTTTLAYNPQGALSYRLVAQQVKYHADNGISWFNQPVMTIYDANKRPGWEIRADKAKLTKDKQLYLQGDVRVSALTPESQLREIRTDNARVNLVNQDIASDDRVTLSGPGIYSSGLKMRGNLRDRTARLIEQVKTSYEPQNTASRP